MNDDGRDPNPRLISRAAVIGGIAWLVIATIIVIAVKAC